MDTLLVFVKAPRPGSVKTRLASVLGAEAAAGLYRAIAEEEIRRTAPRGDEYERLFFHAPRDSAAEMAAWLPGATLIAQGEGDLGDRMASAFEEAFRRGARRAAVIGTDAPGVGREDVLEALFSLDDCDLAIGPATDGGYYLLATGRHRPELFRSIAWSTASVFAATVERAGALGLGVRVLRTMADVDSADDVRSDWGRIGRLLPPDLRREVATRLGMPGPGEATPES